MTKSKPHIILKTKSITNAKIQTTRRVAMTDKPEKVCIECNKELGRYWGRNFCKTCLGQLLTEHMKEEDRKALKG